MAMLGVERKEKRTVTVSGRNIIPMLFKMRAG